MAGASAADTIVAAASPPGDGLRAVLRVSGPGAGELGRRLFGLELGPGREVREVRLEGLGFEAAGRALWMPGPGSYTAEDTLELHVPGAPPLVRAALERAFEAGCRLAEPGEFTRRAFENGRLDLSRAEAVADLIAAETQAERRAAQALLAGGLERRVERVREALEQLCALCEASLDFDESDTGHVPRAELLELAAVAERELAGARELLAARAPVRELPEVVLLGLPNAGKSSLFNWLGGGRALISPTAGTTRDALVLELELGAGRTARLVDLPGLEAGEGALERAAAVRAAQRVSEADLALICVDASRPGPSGAPLEELARGLPERAATERLWVWTKAELGPRARAAAPAELGLAPADVLRVSAHARRGRERLLALIAARLERAALQRAESQERGQLGARHADALLRAWGGLERARAALQAEALPLDLAAEHLREALGPLEEVSGRTQPEDLLTRIFSRFCLGK